MKLKHTQNGEWHWFTGGMIVSLLSIASYILFEELSYKDYPFGITAGVAYIASSFKFLFSSLTENPVILKNWSSPAAFVEFIMLFGIVIGGYVAAKRSKTYSPEIIPAVWEKYHGSNVWKRFAVVLLGGFCLGLGTMIAVGCTTGNILQGWAHLSLGSMIAGASFFIGGIIVAKLLYPKTGGN
jgi:uncharacterized membrane protein YedE/YeeE